jgi:hypothetical protein
MKKEQGVMVELNSELASYFKKHPGQLPAIVDLNSLQINCLPYLIGNSSENAGKTFTDKFLWTVTFPGSKLPGFQYKYFITYKATYMGRCGVVAADMVYERLADPCPWYLCN